MLFSDTCDGGGGGGWEGGGCLGMGGKDSVTRGPIFSIAGSVLYDKQVYNTLTYNCHQSQY